MTREHKLALIVGFSLILLVGVLISDHLSGARQAQVGDFGPGDFRLTETPHLTPQDPLRGTGTIDWSARVREQEAPVAEVDVPTLPSTVARMSDGAAEMQPREVDPMPIVIQQGSLAASTPTGPDRDPSLLQALVERGATIQQRHGIPEVALPAAAQPVKSTPERQEAEAMDWHTVAAGENLYKIAARYYGDGKRWTELKKQNLDRISADDGVRVGAKLRVPRRAGNGGGVTLVAGPPSSATKAARDQAPPRPRTAATTYTVQRGDTLGVISQKTLGTARRWREIMELNGIEDEDHVQAGQVLKIPAR